MIYSKQKKPKGAININKAFIKQMRIKSMADKYSKEHPELTKKEVMRHVVETICGEEGVKKFDELVDDRKQVKKIIKGQDFSSLEKIVESKEFKEASKDVAEDEEIPEEVFEEDCAEGDENICEDANSEDVEMSDDTADIKTDQQRKHNPDKYKNKPKWKKKKKKKKH